MIFLSAKFALHIYSYNQNKKHHNELLQTFLCWASMRFWPPPRSAAFLDSIIRSWTAIVCLAPMQ